MCLGLKISKLSMCHACASKRINVGFAYELIVPSVGLSPILSSRATMPILFAADRDSDILSLSFNETTPSMSNETTSDALISMISMYKEYISPFMGMNCRFQPTCSSYAIASIREFGAYRGIILTLWRILRLLLISSYMSHMF